MNVEKILRYKFKNSIVGDLGGLDFVIDTCHAEAIDDVIKEYINWQKDHSYSEQEVISMLEALRQRCADVSKNRELSPNAHSSRIESIDVHQFIPPKQ